MGRDTDLNIDKVLCLSHTFHLFLGAARSALFPFLTIYFRLLGLTATQTGLLLGAKAFMTLVCAPAWTACAKRFNKKKVVLMFSLFMLMSANLFLCLIPPVSEDAPLRFCNKPLVERAGNVTGMGDLVGTFSNGSTLAPDLGEISSSLSPGKTVSSTSSELKKAKSSTTSAPGLPETPQEKTEKSSTVSTTQKPTTTTTIITTTTAATTTAASTTKKKIKTTTDLYDYYGKNSFPGDKETDSEHERWDGNSRGGSKAGGSSSKDLTPEDKALLRQLGLSIEDLEELSKSDIDELINGLETDSKSRKKRNIVESMRSKWHELSSRFEIAEYQTFVIVLMVIILGELFSAPYEKLSDDCWFEYLDLLDCLEKFGGQHVWRTIGVVLVPTIVTAIIDHTTCILPFGIHHFYIHFFVFAVIMFLVFLTGFCYPVSQNKQTPKRSRMAKGFKVLCSDAHAFSMTFTMVVLGAASAVMANFLMWKLQDLANGEIVMGVAVAVAASSEFVLQLVGRSLVKKLTCTGAVCLGLLLLVGRLVFYSFLWSSWLVLAGEVLHGMTITLIWIAVRTYPDFRINPFVMDRSASSVVTGLYIGVGFAGGSMVSGLVYDRLGYSILFQGTAGIVFLWSVIFLILQKAVKKKEKVRYAKLLQDENADDSDESIVYEDDWLEVAMKRDR